MQEQQADLQRRLKEARKVGPGIRRVSGEARAPRKHWKLELGLDYPVKRGT